MTYLARKIRMIDCKECQQYAQLIFSRGEIVQDEIEKLALDRHILKGCDDSILDDSNVIKLKNTTPDFRKGFISAMRCILDMGKGSHTYHSLLGVVESIITLNENNNFFPGTDIDDGAK